MPIIVSKANRSLVVPATNSILNLIPDHISLRENGRIIVPHDLRTTIILKHLGYDVPNPMLTYYDWCGGKPFAIQKATCAMLTLNPRSYVLNDMGTGKTKAALWAWDYLNKEGYAQKVLIVAPLSTLNFVWLREAFATLPHRKVAILHGPKSVRLQRLADPEAEIFVINHDGLKVIEKELAERTDIDTLILDELAVYRNNSARSKNMRNFAKRFPWVWGMTGRPMPNTPTDVWAQCRIVTPATVPKYFRLARDMLMVRKNQFLWLPKPDAVNTAFKMMRPQSRFSLDDVLELPELVVPPPRDVELSPEQDRIYTRMVREFRAMVEEKVITAVNAGVAMSKLLQVACGYVYTKNPEYVTLDSTPRQTVLLEIIEEVEGKLLIFVPYRHALAGLSALLTTEKVDHAVVHGGTTNRDEIFNLFQNTDKYTALLAHPKCLAHGLTLTAARTIVWYSPTASLDLYEQANARIRRVGQLHKQQVLHLQGTAVEKKIYRLLQGKQRIQDQFLKMLEEGTPDIGS
jgi:SNF2 family DNA or RNA helicase